MMFTRSKKHIIDLQNSFQIFLKIKKRGSDSPLLTDSKHYVVVYRNYRKIKLHNILRGASSLPSVFIWDRKEKKGRGLNNRAICQVRCLDRCHVRLLIGFFFSFDAGENRKENTKKVGLIIHSFNINTNAERPRADSWLNLFFPCGCWNKKSWFFPSCKLKLEASPVLTFFLLHHHPSSTERKQKKVSTDDAPVKVKTRIIYNQKADDPLLDTQCYVSVCLSISPPLFPRPGRCWPAPSSNQVTSSSSSLLSSSPY